MKKIFLAICFAFLAVNVSAQTDPNRTATTKVSDALALLPAQDGKMYEQLMGDLVSTGDQGLTMLTDMFTDVNNVAVNYALSGWAAYSTKPGNEPARKVFESGVLKALSKSADPEIQAYYIRLLNTTGSDASVPALKGYIGNANLFDPALAALVSIKTPAAKQVIADAVGSPADKVRLAKAVGDAQVEDVEAELLAWLPNSDAKTKQAIYYALSKTGSMASLPVLSKAAASVGYADEPTQAVEAYATLLSRLGTSDKAKIGKEALALIKNAAAKQQYNAALAGFEVYASIYGKEAATQVTKALDSPSRIYRVGVLDIAAADADAGLYQSWLAKAQKTKNPETLADVITMAGLSADASLTAPVAAYIGNNNPEVNIAAMKAASLLGGNDVPAMIATEMGKANSQDVIDAAKQALLSYKGNVNDVVAPLVQSGTEAGQIAALQVLGSRRATEQAAVVMAALASGNAKVSQAAYAALPQVVSQADTRKLFTMLNQADEANLAMLQQAITSSMHGRPTAEQLQAIGAEMQKDPNNLYRYLVPYVQTGDVKALEAVAVIYKNSNVRKDKDAAINAFLAWNGMESAEYLYQIAKEDKSIEALNGYIGLIRKSNLTPENKVIMLNNAMDIASTPAQKEAILRQVGNQPIFQAFILAGKYLGDPNTGVQQRAAEAVMNTALANKAFYGPVVTELLNKASSILNGPDSSYQREAIAKHISELPAAGGYVSMFNGVDLTGWKGLVENPIARAKMTPKQLAEKQKVADETMHREWIVRPGGELVFEGKSYDNICTEKPYGDFEMYVDWKLYPDGPEADGGIYLRGTPQVQMWDIARTNVGAQVGSGGLYNNSRNPRNPSKVADNKLGEWNTFYIKMVGERVTVILNGEKVVDNVILENYWDRKQPIFPIEQIELQAHGTRVGYRNLYINELPRVEPFELSAEEQKEGYKVLFDGTSMHHWMGNTQDYVAEDGMIVLYPSNGHGGNLYTKEQYGDFVFRFEFMLTPGANNGLGIRTPTEGDAAYVGMELQILDDDAPIYSELEEYQYHGSVYGVIAAKRGHLKPMGEWNYEEVSIKGNRIKITLNGTVIVDGDLAEASKNGTLDGKDHPGLLNKTGHIAFLGHGSVVKFKNIRIKKL